MNKNSPAKIFLVDDDAVYLKMLEIEFQQSTGYVIETYSSGEECVRNLARLPDLVVLDYHLNGIQKNAIDGIKTLDKIKALNQGIPVVMLSSQDKIEVAIDCMHHKASDYIVKSETAFLRLTKSISAILHTLKVEKTLSWYMEKV